MRISDEMVEKIKQENDIVDVVSEVVSLKRHGRNYFGLCPFHNDKSPSLSVSQDKQIYKCFSCNEAGNVITFVMKQKNMNFPEALKYLADRANIPLEIGDSKSTGTMKKKEALFKANVETARFYFKALNGSRVAKEYFTNRGIKESTIRRFGLGYAKDGWNNLIYYLRKKGFKDEVLQEAGLILKSEKKGTLYDRFRNRVMFPVFDIKGNVIGFGGRVLDDSKPKYLNSPETLIFQKGTNLYGLNFALKDKIEDRYFIIVEGYMDCISLHQYGITNVVASLGTALTINQARLLKRYADKIIISYDADIAGQNATIRGLEILKEAGLDVRVLVIPEGKDPDEFIRVNGKEAFLKLVNSAESLIEYRLNRAEEDINFKNREMHIKYIERVSEIFINLNAIEKDVYIKKVSEEKGISEESIYRGINTLVNKNNQDMNKKEEFRTELYLEPAYLKAEKTLIKLMFNDDYFDFILKNISEDELFLEAHKKIFNLIISARQENVDNLYSYVEARCDDVEASKELVKIQQIKVIKAKDDEKLIKDCMKKVKVNWLTEKIQKLKKEQNELEKKGMIEETIKLAMELTALGEKLKELNLSK